ncbi:hypothetical protein OZ401_000877 [Candidatus Chlorohelix allophototropha]|uniref:Uncharacterized protein n=1 Tax=Candidatus Chlorohelix allophototropha TaxID=3003348 RepID=A0ABY9B329_9CHLR|nr:hypothetical protein OZ401_000877 [Chloroflexota bacterium L227-S17]
MILSLIIGLFLPRTVLAQTPAANDKSPITSFKSHPLVDGLYRENGWATIVIEITNGNNPFQGEIRSNFSLLVNAVSSDFSFVTPVSLTPNQSQIYFHYIQPTTRNNNITVGLYDSQGKLIAQNQHRLQQISASDFIVGILNDSPTPPDIPRIGFTPIRGNSVGIRGLGLQSVEMSDRKEQFDPLNALVISNIKPDTFTAEKRRALQAWVANGGQLILFGGSNLPSLIASVGLDTNLLPAMTNSTLVVNHLSFKSNLADQALEVPGTLNLEISRFIPNPNAFIASRQDVGLPEADLPLVVSRPFGQGSITMGAADLLVQPLSNWNRVNFVWANLILAADPNFTLNRATQNFFSQDGIGRALLNAPGPSLPDEYSLLGIMLLYVALVVPFSYLILRRFSRLELFWLVAPCFVVVFTIITAIFAVFTPAGDVHLSRVSLIESTSDELPAAVKSYMLVSSSSDSPYQLELEGTQSLLRPQPLSISSQVNFLPPQVLVEGSTNASIKNADSNSRLQSFAGEGITDLRLGLEGKFTIDNGNINGTLVNKGNYHLSEAVLMYGDNYLNLGEINPNDERKISFTITRRPTLTPRPAIDSNIYVPLSYLQTNPESSVRLAGSQNPWFSGNSHDARLGSLHWNILNVAYQSGRFIPDERATQLYLTGWLDSSPILGSAQILGMKVAQQDSALIIRPLPLSYGEANNKLIIPSYTLIPERLTDTTGSNNNVAIIGQSPSTFQYQLPSGLTFPRYLPTTLSIYINSFRERERSSIFGNSQSISGWRDPQPVTTYQYNPRIELFNWAKNSWVEVSQVGDNRNRIDLTMPDLNDYIDRNLGTIRLRLASNQEIIILQQLNIGVEGQNFT